MVPIAVAGDVMMVKGFQVLCGLESGSRGLWVLCGVGSVRPHVERALGPMWPGRLQAT